MPIFRTILILLFMISVQAGDRPATWSRPVESPRLKNIFQVDDKVYRSAQPSAKAFAEARQMGVTGVLNLRRFHSDDDEAKGQNLKLYHLRTRAGALTQAQLQEALRIIIRHDGPVLVHCYHGSDRTGAVVAAYRVVVQGWDKDEAVREMVDGGQGFHSVYGNLPALIRSLDVPAMRRSLGLAVSPTQR